MIVIIPCRQYMWVGGPCYHVHETPGDKAVQRKCLAPKSGHIGLLGV